MTDHSGATTGTTSDGAYDEEVRDLAQQVADAVEAFLVGVRAVPAEDRTGRVRHRDVRLISRPAAVRRTPGPG